SFGYYVFYSLHKNFPMKRGGLVVQNTMELKTISVNEIELEDDFSFQLMQYDAEKIALKRQENYKIMDTEIKNIKGIHPFMQLAQNDIPHTYPVIVENDLREKLYFFLAEKKMTVISLYYRLIDPLHNVKFDKMQLISNNILNLPIHQDMNKLDIGELVDGI